MASNKAACSSTARTCTALTVSSNAAAKSVGFLTPYFQMCEDYTCSYMNMKIVCIYIYNVCIYIYIEWDVFLDLPGLPGLQRNPMHTNVQFSYPSIIKIAL